VNVDGRVRRSGVNRGEIAFIAGAAALLSLFRGFSALGLLPLN
jgi:hypothetical protein